MSNVSAPAKSGASAPNKSAPAFQGAVAQAKASCVAPPPAKPAQSPAKPRDPQMAFAEKQLASAASRIQSQVKHAPPDVRADLRDAMQDIRQAKRELATPPRYPQHPAVPRQAAKPDTTMPEVADVPSPQADPSRRAPSKAAPAAGSSAPGQQPHQKPAAGPSGAGGSQSAHPSGGAGNSGPTLGSAGQSGYGASVPPQKFDVANNSFIDATKWFKEGLFGVRAFGRLPLEGALGTGGLIPRTTEKLFNLRVESLAQRGVVVPGLTKAPGVVKPIVIPGAATAPANPRPIITSPHLPAANGKPLIIPGQVTPPVNPPKIITGPQGIPSGKPLVIPGQTTPSGLPVITSTKSAIPPPTTVEPQIKATEARLGKLTSIANGTKVIGLGGFSIFANLQKGAEIYGFWTSGDTGDKGRAVASGAEFLNNARIGMTGFSPLMKPGSAMANFTSKYMGGTFGMKLGVGANVVAGGARMTGAALDYRTEMAQAKTGHDRNVAHYKVWEKTVGIGLDTGNDIYPYIAGKAEPLAWSTWLGGKLADHGAQTILKDSGYKPVSIGAEKARNIMPLVSLLGDAGLPGVPTRPDMRDMTKSMSPDQKLVAQFDNGINKAAGIGAGVTDLTVTAVELGAVAYATRGKETVPMAYAVLNLDHAVRQGLNVWTDRYWQRPQEREASVKAAGLDPKLDTRAVVHEQQDFLHRTWAQASANFTSGYLDGKEDFGKNSQGEQRWLDLDRQYTSGKIPLDTARASSAWYDQMLRPETVVNVVVPGMPLVSKAFDPKNIGIATAYTQEYAGRAVEAAGKAWNQAGEAWTTFWKH